MDFYQFYQLFRRHLLLLILVPVVLAFTVYLFTRNQPKTFSSSTVIYTGIATGYSIETTDRGYLDYYGTNVQFDNLINLFNSRQIIEQTAIKLLTQDLTLEQPNPQYISVANWEALQRMVPKNIKDLVVKNGKMGLEREKEEQIRNLETEIKSLEREIARKRNRAEQSLVDQPKETQNTGMQGVDKTKTTEQQENLARYHTVQAGENIYTIASRYGMSVGEIMEINNLSSNQVYTGQVLMLESSQSGTENQYHTVSPGETLFSIAKMYGVSISDLRRRNNLSSNAIQNGQRLIIRSGQSYGKTTSDYGKEVSSPYNTNHEPEPGEIIDPSETRTGGRVYHVPHLNTNFPEKDPIVPPGVKKSDFDATLENFTRYYRSSDTNFIYELLHYNHKHYSIGAINQKSRVSRIGASDLVEITYESDDPGICQQTLKILADVFVKNYKQLRINQTDAVVRYFQEQVDSANARLQRAEDRLLRFNKKNNIINYYEQSRFIAEQKEELDTYYQNEQIRLASAAAAIKEIETRLMDKDSIYLSTDEINKVRKKLQKVDEMIYINQLDAENDPRIGDDLNKLKRQAEDLRKQMKYLVDKYYMYSHSPEGIPVKELLTDWMENVLAFESSKAALRVLDRRKQDFQTVYQIMAPLGAMLKRIEREINVAEQSYLELLRSLNLAKMKQQNLEMATNIKIVDEPFFPIAAQPSRTKLLILIAAVAGFVLVAFIIIVLEFFDTSIKTPERIQKLTKLKLAGAYPRVTPGPQSKDFRNISDRLLEIIIQNIKLNISKNSIYQSDKPYLVLLFSTKPDTGKTTIATNLIRKLREYGEKVLYLNYERENKDENDDDLNYAIRYKLDNKFVEIKHISDLIQSQYIREENYKYDYIFLELPAIIYNSFPLDLIETVDLSLLILNAKDHWQKSDNNAMQSFLEVSREKPMVVLNMAEVYALEDLINAVPKQSGFSIRKKVREFVTYPSKVKIRVKVDN
ncbi:MAG: LysM peptidoglycan-binding domain-containing protein [Bacteroidales bacterium]|nr:LysM peptidoglycan-binding domain-containing protein [Bacteroidales bacterium]MCF8399003.1 LysM peptidoglycan-binding domain-containing protein [Bacteroidales bacterium]